MLGCSIHCGLLQCVYGAGECSPYQTKKAPIATGVWAADTFYLSGQLADPLTPADTQAIRAQCSQIPFGTLDLCVSCSTKPVHSKDVGSQTVGGVVKSAATIPPACIARYR